MQFFNAETNQDPTTHYVYLLKIVQHPYRSVATGAAALLGSHCLAHACTVHSQLPAGSPPSLTMPTFLPS